MTRYLQNLHTHTIYCDGKDTAEEMILAACEKGFRSLGFSTHSFMYDHKLPQKKLDDYKQEVSMLKKKYADKIELFCGLECEMRGDIDLSGYDYLLGAVHYLPLGKEFVGFDRSEQVVQSIIQQHFGGDGMSYAKAYYQQLALLPQYGTFDIIAHFDLITKHCGNCSFFDKDAKEYRFAAIEAAEALAGKIPYFEVNTGAIARGYRTTPYPSPFLVKELKQLGFGAVISSDCHDSAFLDCSYDLAAELLRECGYKEHYVLTKQGFAPQAL